MVKRKKSISKQSKIKKSNKIEEVDEKTITNTDNEKTITNTDNEMDIEWENVNDDIKSDNINIKIDLSKKKSSPMMLIEKYLKKAELNRIIGKHSFDLICIVVHYMYINNRLLSSDILNKFYKYIPKKFKIIKENTLESLNSIIEWVKKYGIKIYLSDNFVNDINISNKIYNKTKILVGVLRSLNYNVRLVSSIHPYYSNKTSSKVIKNLSKMIFESKNNDDINKTIYEKLIKNQLNTNTTKRPILSPDNNNKSINYYTEDNEFIEVYINSENKYISICCKDYSFDKNEIFNNFTKPIIYIISFDHNNRLKDLTYRYINEKYRNLKKYRLNHVYFEKLITKYKYLNTIENINDDTNYRNELMKMDLPNLIVDFKDHPIYFLSKNLLKFQYIYPSDAEIVGYYKNYPIYYRFNVYTLQSRERWFIKYGYTIKEKEVPIKIITRKTISRKEKTLELFGEWQTIKYIPPSVSNKIVPKNTFGNIEIYKPWMLPSGSVHITLKNAAKLAKSSNIDYAPAVIDWEYGKNPHPLISGIIIARSEMKHFFKIYHKNEINLKKEKTIKQTRNALLLWEKMMKILLIRIRINKSSYFNNNIQ